MNKILLAIAAFVVLNNKSKDKPTVVDVVPVKQNKGWGSPVQIMTVRNDAMGHGHFMASRSGGSRQHKGIDYEVVKGQAIYSPISGKVTRTAQPYANDKKYSGIVIQNNRYVVKIFYMKTDLSLIGQNVVVGQKIGLAQSISEKYSSAMKDHIHIEVYEDGKIVPFSDFV